MLLTEEGLLGCHSDVSRFLAPPLPEGTALPRPTYTFVFPLQYNGAVRTEIALSGLIWDAGYEVFALMNSFRESDDFSTTCTYGNPTMGEGYPGGVLPAVESIFIKVGSLLLSCLVLLFARADRRVTLQAKMMPGATLEAYTRWSQGYSSYDACPVWSF